METDSKKQYSQFLHHISKSQSKSCSCLQRTRPRNWIHPPCLTTKPQIELSKNRKLSNRQVKRSYSNPDDLSVNMESTMDSSDSEEDSVSSTSEADHDNLILQLEVTKRERKALQDALKKYDSGEKLPKSTKSLVHKWKSKDSVTRPSLHFRKQSPNIIKTPLKNEKKIFLDLETHFNNLSSQEKKQLLHKINSDEKGGKDDTRCQCDELSKKTKKLSKRKEKRSEVGVPHYKYMYLKKKHADLKEHLYKLENDKEVLNKENKALRSACEEYASSKDQVTQLENEILKLRSYVNKCEGELNYVKAQNDKLKNASRTQSEQKESDIPLERELGLLKNLNETKMVYEKAIERYKNELSKASQRVKELTEQLAYYVNQWETKETLLKENFQRQISDLKKKLASKVTKPDDSETRKHIIKLEKCLSEKDSEIKKLEQQLKDLKGSTDSSSPKSENFQKQVLGHFEKLLNQAGSGLSTIDRSTFLDSIKETVSHCFRTWEESGQLPRGSEGDSKLEKKIEELNQQLKEKTSEAQNAKDELRKNREKLESLYVKLESKGKDENDLSEGLEALKQFPELLKSAEAKLSDSEESHKKIVIENKLLTERLERSQSEIHQKDEQIKAFEERLLKQNECLRTLEKDLEKSELKIENLQRAVERKDEILERNSTQLEDRIRSCAALNAQIEKLKDEHFQEIHALKSQSNTHDSHCHAKLADHQSGKARLEAELSALKIEKSSAERLLKRQIKALEDELEQLKFKNRTYQRQLETISSTYKSLFSSTGDGS